MRGVTGPMLWTKGALALFKKLNTPIKIQIYLNKLAYDSEPGTAKKHCANIPGRLI
jgi:hypothetical protein